MSVNLFKFVFIQLIGISLFFTQVYADTQSTSADTAIVKIKSKDTTGYPVRLMYTDHNESKFVLNAKAVNGIYEFHIPVKGYSKAVLYITSSNSIIKTGQSFIPQPAPQFLIKGGKEVSIIVNFNDPLDLLLKTIDPEIQLYESFSARERRNHQLIWEQMKIKFARPGVQEKIAEAEREIAKLSKDLNAYKKEFVIRNRNTFAALLVFESYYTELGNELAFEQLKTIAAGYKNSTEWMALYAKLKAANATAKGAVIPAFQVADINGKIFNSQTLGGKYLLIDFWGSWCQPCRASHPELKEIYERYQSKGLEILGIAYESGSAENQLKQWKKAIAEDQINWIQVLNTPQNNLVKLFGVSSYPTKILVDPKGNILFRTSGNSDGLKKQLSSIFDQNSPVLASLNKNISRDSLLNYLNQKLTENTAQSETILKAEAEALKKSSDEENLLLAVKLYKVMGNNDAAQAVEKDLPKKFPKGIMARDLAYDKVFGSKPELPLSVVEKDYLNWLKEYPPSRYTLKQRDKYDFALLTLI
ncbi:TlpA disulfide reductase family protein, partial [Pedobacter sp.]|uniref:TlpA family protein disulfide reductase n=1 Tax=Pedobacter sp. TaxID=1411316 RepID=UPI002BED028D